VIAKEMAMLFPPFDAAVLIRDVNDSNETVENQCLRARHAADVADRSARAAEELAISAQKASVAHSAVQAEHPRRSAPLPRQAGFALTTITGTFVSLLGVLRFWYLVTIGAGGIVPAIVGAGLFTVATGGFLALGYRALRAAETPQAWRHRREARYALRAARIAQAIADYDAWDRDRLIDAYLDHVRRVVLKTCPAEQQLAMESVVRKLLAGRGS
jgi:hypothetical protein